MASLSPYAITLGSTDYPVKYAGLLSYVEPYLTNLESFTFSAGNVSLAGNFTLGAASDLTLNKGTANGVLYLNGSKVATSGSALTFDGALLAVGGTATEKITTNGAIRVTGSQTTAGTGTYLSQSTTSLGELAHYGPDNLTLGQLRFYLASANGGIGGEQMRLTSTGLGIGTSSPTTKLQVNVATGGTSTIDVQTLYDNSTGLSLKTGLDGTANRLVKFSVDTAGTGFVTAYQFNNAQHQFWTNNTERARITSGGDLLVGAAATSTTFDGKLNVAGRVHTKADSGAIALHFMWNEATTGDNGFINFGTEGAFTSRGSITYNRAGGLTAFNTTSDYRAKDIIGPVQNVGATIDALKVYEGKMKGATQSRPMLIAHEAQAHAPYAVSGVKDEVNEDGTPKFQQMDVSSLVPLLLAEIQSLRARVAALEKP